MAEAGSESADPGIPRVLASPGRRAFLRFAAAAGGATLLSACSGNSGSTAASGTAGATAAVSGTAESAAAAAAGRAATASGPPSPADWAALAKDLSGSLVRPGEAGYATARELFDPRFDSLRPAGVAYCRAPHDVVTCLAFVRKYGIPVAARCGGHGYAGWSSTSGLIVDVTEMAGVSVSGRTATVGAGTRLIDFYDGLSAHGRAVPGGSCPAVGHAPVRERTGLPELRRSRPDQLAAGLLRRQLRQAHPGQGRLRPGPRLHLPPGRLNASRLPQAV